MKNLYKKEYLHPIKLYDLRALKQNPNRDLSFKVPGKEIANPNTIIPESLYNDFNRKDFFRNKISFPITIPVHYRRIYHPNKFY
jgi:hypothetical protein